MDTKELDHGDDDASASSRFSHNMDANLDGTTEEVEVAKEEDRWVFWLRVLAGSVLLAVAVTVCVVVFLEGRRSETAAFEEEFEHLGEKLVSSFEGVVEQRFGIIANFAESITANSDHANGSLPFVSPPHFAHRAESVSILAQLFFLIYIPRVAKDQMDAWNHFAAQPQNQQWKREGVAQQMGVPPDQLDVDISPFPPVMLNAHNPNGPAPALNVTPDHQDFYPLWSTYPATAATVGNVDINGDTEHQIPIATTVATGTPTFEISYDYIDKEKDDRYEMLANSNFVDYQDDPHAVAFFPVFDQFHYDNSQPNVAGLLLIIIYWRTYFDNLLPPGADGIFVILENTCDQQFTYRVDGVYSTFFGHGDLHNPKYDYLEAGVKVGSVLDTATSTTKNDTSTTTRNNGCLYSIRVYPSQDFEDQHRTNKPWIYVLVLASLFLFTSAVFLLYDYMVEQRQKIVLHSAQQSGKLVNTLFPEAVRDQLYQEQQEQAKLKEQKETWTNTHIETIGGDPEQQQQQQQQNQGLDPSAAAEFGMVSDHKKAIASLYPETTIFFADLVGFTAWSGKRTPEEVFQLLESLYGAFDDIAVRRKVFKVETIGDCYVAATGLPQAQLAHAVILCKFATNCMAKMKVLTASLADTLGEDTTDLAMRVGLHSGPVTAGVLRGAKSRFQLFGDTVNVASRMESNGVPNRIHVSEATANALRKRGKACWLIPREDKVYAKGKGELQTYFVNTSAKSQSVISSGESTVISSDNQSRSSGNTGRRRMNNLAGLTVGEEQWARDMSSSVGDPYISGRSLETKSSTASKSRDTFKDEQQDVR